MSETNWKAALKINGDVMNGIEIGKGFMSAIGGSAPLKEYVTNSNSLHDGVQYADGAGFTPKLNERRVTLNFYISGKTVEEYEANKAAFFAELYKGSVDLSVPSRSANIYHLKYLDGVSYSESRNGCFSQYSAKFVEPNPANRATSEAVSGQG